MSTTPESSARDERAPSRSDVDRVVGSFPAAGHSAAPGRRHLVADHPQFGLHPPKRGAPVAEPAGRADPPRSSGSVAVPGETFERGTCRGREPPFEVPPGTLLGGSCTGRVSDVLAPLPRSRGNV